MLDDRRLHAANINVVHRIVAPTMGVARFYISDNFVSADGSSNRGHSSTLFSREHDVVEQIELPTARIHEYIGSDDQGALWIDVEGAGYDVLSTAAPVARNVSLIHIESELRPRRETEKLKPELVKLATELGFTLIAHSAGMELRDLVFVNNDAIGANRRLVDRAIFLTRLHGSFFARWLSR
jgi:hypothetical protein